MRSKLEIAQTILEQIRGNVDSCGNSGVILAMCWGMKNPAVCYEEASKQYGLEFKVRGAKLKGYVRVLLDEGLDLYDVGFYNSKREVVKVVESVYAEDLLELIDGMVEK